MQFASTQLMHQHSKQPVESMITGALDPSQPDLLTYAGLNGRVGRFTPYRRRTAFPSLEEMSEVHGVMSIPTSKRKGCIWQAVVIPMAEPPAQ